MNTPIQEMPLLKAPSTNISHDFVWNETDARLVREIVQLAETPGAIVRFSECCDALSDYAYWFILGTLWVSYSGWSDIDLWRRLFSSPRPNRATSIMKPSELAAFNSMPWAIRAFRAHRDDETDWIAYTISPDIAARFAVERGQTSVSEYSIAKHDLIALFLRRGEFEVLCLDKTKANKQRDMLIFPTR